MNFMSYLYIGIAVLLLSGLIVFLFLRKPKRRQSIQNEYIAGLQALVSGDQERALEKFRYVVRRDTDYVDAYILIGNIFRDRGSYENAIKVHRDLLVRPNLTVEQQKSILESLAQDYQLNKQPKWALSTCDKILELDKKSEWAKQFKQTIFEDMGDWQGAFEILRKNSTQPKEQKTLQLAAYKVMQGLQFAALHQEHEARLRYREAIKLNSGCKAAYMELVRSYVREDRHATAMKELKKFVQVAPEYVDIALSAFEDFLFEAGHFDDMALLYQQAISARPQSIGAYIGLAEIYQKKGELRKAVEICQKAQKYDADNLRIKSFLILTENKLQRYDKAAGMAATLAADYLKKPLIFRCSNCGYEQTDHNLRCPQCRTWNSVERKS